MSEAYLDGLPLLGSTVVTWKLTDGIAPFSTVVDIAPSNADAIMGRFTGAGLRPLTLRIGPLTVKNVYAIQRVAADDPATANVMLVDCRWFWTHSWVRRIYNLRRRYGVKRLENPANVGETAPLADDIQYAPFSIQNNATKWDAKSVLQDITSVIFGVEQLTAGRSPKLIFDGKIAEIGGSGPSSVPIENLMLEDNGQDAMMRVLDYIPGAGLYVDLNGDVHVYSKADGSEIDQVNAALPEKVGGGHVEPISLANVRPSKIIVCFPRECEVRFDAAEGVTVTSDSPEPRVITNVLPLPDYAVAINGVNQVTGTWVAITDAFTGWGSAPFQNPRPLTTRDMQIGMCPFNSLLTALNQVGLAIPSADWGARIGAAQANYRTTYQITRKWMDRIWRLAPYRVGTLNTVQGVRGNASVYSDFAFLSGERSLYVQAGQGIAGADMSFITNVARYPVGGTIGATTSAAMAELSIVDEDQGVLHLNFVVDRFRRYESVFPSQIELTGQATEPGVPVAIPGPTGNFEDGSPTRPWSWNMFSRSDLRPQLTAKDKKSIILTAQPAPGWPTNGDPYAQFCQVEVKPQDVSAFAGQAACKGPVLYVAVGAGIETARVAWLDDHAADIEAAFGVGGAAISTQTAQRLADITVNLSSNAIGAAGGGASLNAIAKAMGTRIYHSLADRAQGMRTTDLIPSLHPAGWLSEVEHSLAMSGEYLSRITLPERVDPMRLEAWMDATTRMIVMRLATPGAQK